MQAENLKHKEETSLLAKPNMFHSCIIRWCAKLFHREDAVKEKLMIHFFLLLSLPNSLVIFHRPITADEFIFG